MATKPPPLPPDARRPTRGDDDDAPDTDPDNPPPAPAGVFRAPPPRGRRMRRPRRLRFRRPSPPRRRSPSSRPRPSWSRPGKSRRARRADRRSPTVPTAASSTGCCGSTRSAGARSGSLFMARVRNLHLLRGDAAAAARPRDLPRGGRDDDGDARLGRHAAGRVRHRAPRDPPFDRFPPQLMHAFLAAEDRRFYEHGGLDYRGIARALAPTCAPARSRRAARPSRSRWRSRSCRSERTLQRKIREAILARRLERHFSKRDILTLYLNQIFLGHGAYGVGGGGAALLRQGGRRARPRRDGACWPAWRGRPRASRR